MQDMVIEVEKFVENSVVPKNSITSNITSIVVPKTIVTKPVVTKPAVTKPVDTKAVVTKSEVNSVIPSNNITNKKEINNKENIDIVKIFSFKSNTVVIEDDNAAKDNINTSKPDSTDFCIPKQIKEDNAKTSANVRVVNKDSFITDKNKKATKKK